MKVEIAKIKVTERIRKDVGDIAAFAAEIKQNGLLQAIVVMPVDGENGEKYQLLAGLRRLKAVGLLGWTEIDAHVVSVSDAHEALRIEISENEQRKPFTTEEKAYFGKLIEDVEDVKAKERMSVFGATGGRGNKKGSDARHTPLEMTKGKVVDKVGKALGMSGRTYERLKYVAENAPPEIIERIDNGESSVYKEYNKLRSAATPTPPPSPPTPPTPLPPPPKPPKQPTTPAIPENMLPKPLEEEVKELRVRAARAESELADLKVTHHNAVSHKDSIIDSLKRQLETAHAKIAELEELANVAQ